MNNGIIRLTIVAIVILLINGWISHLSAQTASEKFYDRAMLEYLDENDVRQNSTAKYYVDQRNRGVEPKIAGELALNYLQKLESLPDNEFGSLDGDSYYIIYPKEEENGQGNVIVAVIIVLIVICLMVAIQQARKATKTEIGI